MGRLFGLLLLVFASAACHEVAPSVRVASSRELSPVGQSSLIIGRDGGWSARLFDRLVFTFGDTFVSQPDALNGSTFHSNSFSITDDPNAADGIGPLTDRLDAAGSPLPLLPATAEEQAFFAAHQGQDDQCAEQPCGARWATWAGGGVFDATRNRALVSYGLLYTEPGDFNFRGVGGGIAVWSDFAAQAERPTSTTCPEHPTTLFCEHEDDYSSALVIEGEMLYGFACDDHCRVARVPLASALDRSAWQLWDGAEFSGGSHAASLFGKALNPRFHWNAHANAWLVVYSTAFSNDIQYRTAPALTGPWSDAATLFVADQAGGNGTYDAYVQPDYSEENGRILYVTFSRGTGTWFGSELALVQVTLE